MEYRVVICEVSSANGTDFDRAAAELAREVSRMISAGYEPTGGVAVGYTQSSRKPYLFQAVWRRPEMGQTPAGDAGALVG